MPSLDGLRAVSILLVMLAHAERCHGWPLDAKLSNLAPLGNLGVRVFFVISGFIITTLLVAERARCGRIDLVGFYWRRTFRIFPAYFVYLAAVIVAWQAGLIGLTARDLAHALTYTLNYYPERSWHVAHGWSLAVEEQFYLIWPAALLWGGFRGGLRAAAAMLLISPMFRVANFLGLWWGDGAESGFEMMADAIASGCLLAGWRDDL